MRGARSTRRIGIGMLAALLVGIVAIGEVGRASAAPSVVPDSVAARSDERLEYHWRVQGFFGALAGLFFPAEGEGSLSRRWLESGNFESELLITSDADDRPDFFRYGAEIDGRSGATVRAWSSQLWRGKRKDKLLPLVPAGAVDTASAIDLMRRERPRASRRMEIWSDGHLYPVLVQLLGSKQILVDRRRIEAAHIAVRPLVEPQRRIWKGELDLWLAEDAASTPVEILVSRSPARVLLSLKRYP